MNSDSTDKGRRATWAMSAALLLVVVALAAWAVHLNHIFYAHNAPIYDSMAYTYTMAQVDRDAQSVGGLQAIRNVQNTTVLLPWIETALIAGAFPVSRATGVWLQAFWLVPLVLSMFYYFHRLRKCDALSSFAATIPFVGLWGVFRYNGGLSDFRMDLSLYTFYALACVWYLATFYTDRIYPWLLCGAAMGLACLARATAPMYFVLGLGPLIVARLIVESKRGRLIGSMFAAAATALAVGGWFLIINYRFLHYYYFVWNFDANARYPLSVSLRHVRYGLMHVGIAMGIFGLIFLLRRVGVLRAMARGTHELPLRAVVTRLDFAALWLGLAPIVMLVSRGAGDNPHVSMPAAFGLILFMLFPHRGEETYRPARVAVPAMMAAMAVVMLVVNAAAAVPAHVKGFPFNTKSAYTQTLDRIWSDAKTHRAHDLDKIRFAVGYAYYFMPQGLMNMLVFDSAYQPAGDEVTKYGYATFTFDRQFGVTTEVEWNQLPGGNDGKRIENLADRARRSVEYLVLPDENSLSFLETNPVAQISVSNRYARRLREKILQQGIWEPLGGPLRNNSEEVFVIYANRNLVPGGKLATMPLSTQGER